MTCGLGLSFYLKRFSVHRRGTSNSQDEDHPNERGYKNTQPRGSELKHHTYVYLAYLNLATFPCNTLQRRPHTDGGQEAIDSHSILASSFMSSYAHQVAQDALATHGPAVEWQEAGSRR